MVPGLIDPHVHLFLSGCAVVGRRHPGGEPDRDPRATGSPPRSTPADPPHSGSSCGIGSGAGEILGPGSALILGPDDHGPRLAPLRGDLRSAASAASSTIAEGAGAAAGADRGIGGEQTGSSSRSPTRLVHPVAHPRIGLGAEAGGHRGGGGRPWPVVRPRRRPQRTSTIALDSGRRAPGPPGVRWPPPRARSRGPDRSVRRPVQTTLGAFSGDPRAPRRLARSRPWLQIRGSRGRGAGWPNNPQESIDPDCGSMASIRLVGRGGLATLGSAGRGRGRRCCLPQTRATCTCPTAPGSTSSWPAAARS